MSSDSSDALERRLAAIDRIIARLSNGDTLNPPSKATKEAQATDYAPIGLESVFAPLHQTLSSCHHQNSLIILQGPRGSGKTLLVNRVIAAVSAHQPLRVVRLQGPLLTAHPASIVYDMLRQLTEPSLQTSSSATTTSVVDDFVRLRQTSFRNHRQLLDEMLRVAKIDRVPIVVVLDPMEALVQLVHPRTQDDDNDNNLTRRSWHQPHQLLLYHLLDRVAGGGDAALLTVVAISSHQAVLDGLEKRVQSRAGGTAQCFQVPRLTKEQLLRLVQAQCEGDAWLGETLPRLLQEPESAVAEAFQRAVRLGRDTRWFLRVLATALGDYREDIRKTQRADWEFTATYLQTALVDFGVELRQPNGNVNVHHHPRLRLLTHLSSPQVAIVLACRRILARDGETEGSSSPVLNAQRIRAELARAQRHYRLGPAVLRRALDDLLDMDVLRPAADHVSTGPWQYHHKTTVVEDRQPLQLTFDIHREIRVALDGGMLEGPTSLMEWGKKLN